MTRLSEIQIGENVVANVDFEFDIEGPDPSVGYGGDVEIQEINKVEIEVENEMVDILPVLSGNTIESIKHTVWEYACEHLESIKDDMREDYYSRMAD